VTSQSANKTFMALLCFAYRHINKQPWNIILVSKNLLEIDKFENSVLQCSFTVKFRLGFLSICHANFLWNVEKLNIQFRKKILFPRKVAK